MSANSDIVIDGETYTVVPGEDATFSYEPQFQRKLEDPLWYSWPMRSFHGGEKMRRIISTDDIEQYRYDDGEMVDVGDWGELKLQPELAQDLVVSSSTMPMCVTSDGQRVILGLAISPFIKIWYNGSWTSASAVAGSGSVTHIIAAGTTLYAVRGGAVLTSTNAGANWTEVQYTGPTSYTTAVGLAWVNDELIVLKSDGVFNHTQEEAVSSTGGTSIAEYRESVYWIVDRRLYRYDGTADYIYTWLPPGFVGTALYAYRMALLILGYYKTQSGYKASVHYIIQGVENHLYSHGDYSGDSRIYAATGNDEVMMVASPKRGGVDYYHLTAGGISSGPAVGTACNIPFMSLATCDGYLFMGRYDNDSGTDGVYKANIANPTTYADSGWVTTSEWDFGLPQSKKLWRSITVETRRVLAGSSVIVHASFDGGSTYEPVGTVTPGAAASHEFILTKKESYSIKVKLALYSSGTYSPIITEVRVMGAPVMEAKWRWTMLLDVYEQQDGANKIKALKQLADAQEIVKFSDLRGDTFDVMVDQMEFRQHPGNPSSATVLVSVKEV